MNANQTVEISVFLVLFAIFAFLGFYASRWRKGNLNDLGDWALAGRRLGPFLAWFLIGADLYTAYTFVAVPSGMFAAGPLFFFAVPYVAVTFAIAIITMPKLWVESRKHGFVTAADFVRYRFGPILAVLIALTGIVAELPYIALQIVGMTAVLTVMLQGVASDVVLLTEVSLVISFIVLALFTFTSGLRGATLTAVFKDVLIFITVISVIIIVPAHVGGFAKAFAAKPAFSTLSPLAGSAYWNNEYSTRGCWCLRQICHRRCNCIYQNSEQGKQC